MFIKSSQRQRRAQVQPTPYQLHRQLARERSRRTQLMVSSGGALAVSLGAWLAGLPLAVHLGLTVLAFALGVLVSLVWPSRRAEPWALGWIDARSGLAYRTALETTRNQNPEAAGHADPYGFQAALRTQATQTTKRLELPTFQPWWLPLFAVALSLAVLPNLRFPSGGPGGTSPPSADAPVVTTPEEADASAESDPQPDLERTFDASEEPGDEASAAEEEADSEALERYLDTLGAEDEAETPEAQNDALDDTEGADSSEDAGAGQRNPFARGEAQQDQNSADEQRAEPTQGQQTAQQDGAPEGRPENAQTAPDDAQRAQDQNAAQPGQQENAQNAEQAEAVQEEQDGEGASTPNQTQQAEEGERQEGGSSGSPSEQEQQAEGEQPQAEGENADESQEGQEGTQEGTQEGLAQEEQGEGQTEGAASSSADGERLAEGEPGPQDGGGDEETSTDGEGQGAGNLPSAPTPTGERLGGAPGRAERLEGQRGEGRVSRAGEVLAPGSDEVDIPNARPNAEYERAAEEAINEGRIPVEYQDILRNYFR